MLYGNESISNYTPSNITIWMTLAFQGGAINIGGFMACHRFVSHVTGFATFFGVEITKRDYPKAMGMLLVPVLFLVGAMLSAQLVDVRLRLHKKPKYYLVFGLLFLLLFAIVVCGFNGIFGTFGGPLQGEGYVLLALLCLACGMQNALVSTVSKSVIRTTHLTGLTTDLGIGIVRMINNSHLHWRTDADFRANLMRLGIIFFFGLGSIVGGFIFTSLGYRGFSLPMTIYGLLFFAMLYYQFIRSKISSAGQV